MITAHKLNLVLLRTASIKKLGITLIVVDGKTLLFIQESISKYNMTTRL
jgi:hypothetical protein